MSQMCPNCSFDNPDDARTCAKCPSPLQGLLGEHTVLSERYKVTSVLGCGAMGAVYLAEDIRLAGRRCRPGISNHYHSSNLVALLFRLQIQGMSFVLMMWN